MPNYALAHPRLYLDLDGVIFADDTPFETVELSPIDRYAPEVTNRLGATGLELVLISTWNEEAAYLSERIEAFKNARIIAGQIRGIKTKQDALIADQERKPSPFVWADDMITSSIRRVIASRLQAPHLLVVPGQKVGLTDVDLKDIEAFAQQIRK